MTRRGFSHLYSCAKLALALVLVCAGGAARATCVLPYTLLNGTLADANQVMANFDALLACVNGGGGGGGLTSVVLLVPAGSIFGASDTITGPVETITLTAGGASGGIPGFTDTVTLKSSAMLPLNMPVIGGGAGGLPSTGTVSGNTTEFVTTTGGQISGHCVSIDANGNHIDSGVVGCGGGGVTGFANPTATAGLAAVNGVATTAMRSDSAPAVVAATTSVAGLAKLNNVGYPAGWIATINPNNAVVVEVNQASTITSIVGRVEVAAGAAATVQVNKAASGVACSAGTNLATGTFDANGTAATNQTLTLVGGATDNLAAGDSICYQTTGGANWTNGTAVGTITVFYAPT